MNKPFITSRIYYFDKPIVYIKNDSNKVIGYITMDSEEDLIELAEIIKKGQEEQ